jgi:hypothetical protein
VISAWFFSLYINDLISELKVVNSGISISDLNIPAILLADDTTLHSTSAHGLQRLLDFVQNYACRWRLTYNGTKSCFNVPAYTCSFLFSMNVFPSRTEISESFCLCPSNNIKQLFVPLYVRRQRQA